jgi:hypothetical protein
MARDRRLASALVLAAFIGWCAFVALMQDRPAELPFSQDVAELILYGLPALAAVVALLVDTRLRSLPLAAGLGLAVIMAVVLLPRAIRSPEIALGIPAVVVAALATHRWPAASMGLMFLLASAYGTVDAFTGVPPGQVVDFILGGLWIGVVGSMLLGGRRVPIRATPGAVMIGAFLVMTLGAVIVAQNHEVALRSFRFCGWHLSALLLVGFGAFSDETLERLRRIFTGVILLVSAYAAYRWALGHPSSKEASLLPNAQAYQYDKVGSERKLIGSFPDGFELGLWTACTIPFLIAMLVAGRGLVRLASLVALPMAAIAMFGSNHRTAAAAAVAGGVVIVAVHLLSRGFQGPRLGIALATVVIAMTSAVVLYPKVIDNPEKQSRYELLLTPSEDPSFNERLQKWRNALNDVKDEPFGLGLGTGDSAAIGQRFISPGGDEIDSSYIKIAYEQGLIVMVFFITALLVLLVELLRHALWTRAPGPAALTTAAAGTLVSMMVIFVAAIHIDRLASTTGWMIVGLGLAQCVRTRATGSRPPTAPLDPT